MDSSLSDAEASLTFGGGQIAGEKYTYRRDNGNVYVQGVTITDKNGEDEYNKIFIFPWDAHKNNYDIGISNVNSFDIGMLNFSEDGSVTARISFYYIVGFEFTIGYKFGYNE